MAKASKPVKKHKPKAGNKPRKVGGPYLAAAVFCEALVEDKEDGSMSLTRIIDTIRAHIPPGISPDAPVPVQVKMFLTFRCGDASGEKTASLVLTTPTGKRRKLQEMKLTFTGPEHGGINLRIQVLLNVTTEGVYWIDVIVDGKRFTRMPLMISIVREAAQVPGESQAMKP